MCRGARIANHGGSEYDPLRNAIDNYIKAHSTNGDGLIGLRTAFGHGDILYDMIDWLSRSFEEADSGGIDYVGGPDAGAGVLCGALIMRLAPGHDPRIRRKAGHIKIMKYNDEKDVPEGFESQRYPIGHLGTGEVQEHKVLAIQRGIIREPPKRVILIDDWAETYKQLSACADLIKSQGGNVVGAATVVSIADGRADFEERHKGARLLSLLDYERLPDRSLRRVEV